MRQVAVAFGRLPDGTIYRKRTYYDGAIRHHVLVLRPRAARWKSWSAHQLAAAIRRATEAHRGGR